MSSPEQPSPPRHSRWSVVLGVGLFVALLTWIGIWFVFKTGGGLSIVIAGLVGLLCGLAAGRFYGAAGAIGLVLEALVAAGAAVAGILAAIFGAFS